VGELERLFHVPAAAHVMAVAATDCVLWAVDGRTLRRRAAGAMAEQRAVEPERAHRRP